MLRATFATFVGLGIRLFKDDLVHLWLRGKFGRKFDTKTYPIIPQHAAQAELAFHETLSLMRTRWEWLYNEMVNDPIGTVA